MSEDFGSHAVKGMDALFVFLVKCGLGRSKIKKMMAASWKRRNGDSPVDLDYHGVKLRLYPYANTIEERILFSSRLREQTELDCLRDRIKNGGVFLDIGANVGYYALMAASFGANRVLAIEPNPTVFTRMIDNIKLNRFGDVIAPLQCGVGAEKGTLRLTVSDTDLGSSSMVRTDIKGAPVTVDVEPLSDILQREKIKRIDAMKIDIEGMEDRVLFPFFETAEHADYPKMVVIEDSSRTDWERDILGWMLDNGYEVINRTRGNVIIALA